MDSLRFSDDLLAWYEFNKRALPWRSTKDPYAIWLSEIILQQTRVDQGMSYYMNFLDKYQNVHELASASENEVLSLWQGLGYYSRARNMHKTAVIIDQNGGKFPDTYESIMALPGIGPYTAAAIASFAFDLPYPVMDGNVIRVIARLFGIDAPVNKDAVLKELKKILKELFDKRHPAIWNQAIMEFGALHCTSSKPACGICPFALECIAFRMEKTHEIPYKEKKNKRKKRYFHYLVIGNEKQIILRKRRGKGIWENLYDFPLVEKSEEGTPDLGQLSEEVGAYRSELSTMQDWVKHVLSHQDIYAKFYELNTPDPKQFLQGDWELADLEQIEQFPVPKLISNYLFER
ncbi:MAG: A/G-specific adenine glycosylase [Vicingaceae bacterium]